MNTGKLCLLFVIVIALMVLVVTRGLHTSCHIPHQVMPERLRQIIPVGTYTGESTYKPTENFPNGLFSKHKVQVKGDGDGLVVTNEQIAYDLLSREVAYSAVRHVRFEYRIGFGRKLYRISHSVINGRKGGCSRGYATDSTSERITFDAESNWYITGKEHPHTLVTIERLSESRFQVTIRADELYMSEVYTRSGT